MPGSLSAILVHQVWRILESRRCLLMNAAQIGSAIWKFRRFWFRISNSLPLACYLAQFAGEGEEKTRLYHPATEFRPSDPKSRPSFNRGRRESRARDAPAASRVVKNTRVSRYRFAGTSGLPCAMVLTVSFVLSLVSRACCHHRRPQCGSIVAYLISASGYQDHTTSPSACWCIRLPHQKRPPHPAPNVRDDRETPLV